MEDVGDVSNTDILTSNSVLCFDRIVKNIKNMKMIFELIQS